MKLVCYLQLPIIAEFTLSDADTLDFKAMRPDIDLVNCKTEDEFIQNLSDAEAVAVWVFKQEWFALAPKLKYLCTPAAGRDYFSIIPPKDVDVRYGHFHSSIMAESVLGLVICMSHGFLQNASSMRAIASGGMGLAWPRIAFTGHATHCHSKHALILGFGNIGSEIGRLLKQIGCRITGVKRLISNNPPWFDEYDQLVTLDKLEEILPSVDHVISVLPSDTGAKHIIDKRFLSLLPKSAYIYNVGRGITIDETALADALNSEQIAGAVLDVFEHEPLAENSPLRSAKNCYLFPHISAVSPNYLKLYLADLAKEI